MEEKRRYKRFHVEGMDINCNMILVNECTLLDLSIGGISLKADKRFAMGGEYTVKLRYEDKVLSFKGIVMWSALTELRKGSPGESVPIYKAGLKLADMPADILRELVDLIGSHGVRDYEMELDEVSGKRQTARVRIEPSPETVLDSPVSYRLRKLSLGGMLIETDHEFEIDRRYPMEIAREGNAFLQCEGRVLYCLKGDVKSTAPYNIGMEFIAMSEEDKKKLKEFIRSMDNEGGGSSSFVRIQEDERH